MVVIVNLGAPLDYHLILGAGFFTALYILSRALGKYGGAYIGARITKSPVAIRKYLGFTLLPHSGVSLVFTGIAVSTLSSSAPAEAKIIQGTIAAAAVINEVIAVLFTRKKVFSGRGNYIKNRNPQLEKASFLNRLSKKTPLSPAYQKGPGVPPGPVFPLQGKSRPFALPPLTHLPYRSIRFPFSDSKRAKKEEQVKRRHCVPALL